MPIYTTSDNINIHLPTNVQAAIVAQEAQDISDASDIVDSYVGSRYSLAYKSNAQKFPDITDSPATPAIIEKCARYLAVATQISRIAELAKQANSRSKSFSEKAYKWLEDISDGKTDVIVDGTVLGTSALGHVKDEIYEAGNYEPVFNTDAMNTHLGN